MGIDIYVINQTLSAIPNPVTIEPLPPGKQANITVRSRQLSQSQIANIGAGHTLRMLGIINYKDDNGTVRTTSFVRRYNPILGRFIEVPNDDDEKDRDYEN